MRSFSASQSYPLKIFWRASTSPREEAEGAAGSRVHANDVRGGTTLHTAPGKELPHPLTKPQKSVKEGNLGAQLRGTGLQQTAFPLKKRNSVIGTNPQAALHEQI